MRTFLVRHGDYDRSSDNKEITHRGILEMELVVDHLAAQGVGKAAVFAAQTCRTRQSADIILGGVGIEEVRFTPILSEDFHDFNVLENLGENLLNQILPAPDRVNIDTIIGVSHLATIYTALALSTQPVKRHKIPTGSIHEFIPYRN